MARTGRPKVELVLTEDERDQLTRWSRRAKSSQALALRSRIVLACADGADNKTVAAWTGSWMSLARVARRWSHWTRSRTSWWPPWSRRRPTRRTGHGRRWPNGRPVEVDDRSDLADLRAETPPRGRVQAVQRPAVRREGLRRGRALPQSARGRRRALRGREDPSASAGPIPTGVPDDARHARETHPRLRPARHHQPVRGVQHRRRERDLLPAPTPPGGGVQEVPDQDRRLGPCRPAGASGRRQLRHPQEPYHHPLARGSPPVPHALHPDVLLLDQPGRTVLRLRHLRPAPTLRPPIRPSPRGRHSRLGQSLERRPAPLHLDQVSRTDPRIPRQTSATNYWRRTLDGRSGCCVGWRASQR